MQIWKIVNILFDDLGRVCSLSSPKFTYFKTIHSSVFFGFFIAFVSPGIYSIPIFNFFFSLLWVRV